MSKRSASSASSAAPASSGPDLEKDLHLSVGGGGADMYLRSAPADAGDGDAAGGRAGQSAPGRKTATPPDVATYKGFRHLCDRLMAQVRAAKDCLEGDVLGDQASGISVEVELLLEELYDIPLGKGEDLKRAVLVLKSQVGNLHPWRSAHLAFLSDAVAALRISYHIDDRFVAELQALVKSHGLDLFRGTVAEPAHVRRRYKTVEVAGE